MARVLVVDDEAKLGRLVAEALEGVGHKVWRAEGGRAALVELAARPFDVVVTDLKMPEVDGLQVLAEARKTPGKPEVVMVTAHGSTESAVAAMRLGAADYLLKPFAMEEIRLRVSRLAGARESESVRHDLVERLTPGLVAASGAMKKTLEEALRVAPTDTSVLLTGESGTGKSQLARYIHFNSARAAGQLAEVHCAALTETLLESELFGHVKGAFTGATATSEGHLKRADGGTLFLDEIGEVTASTQVKLLRFLQEREFSPVGSAQPQKVNVRVVTATNRDLAASVKAGRYREDFYYRLAVFTIAVPPLRERPEDIAALAERFLNDRGLPKDKLADKARERLLSLPWPGNVRQLLNALERALILAGEGQIGAELFEAQDAPSDRPAASALIGPGFNLDGFERDLIYAALDRAGGNKTNAAKLLGITRRRLYSRLESIQREEKDEEPA